MVPKAGPNLIMKRWLPSGAIYGPKQFLTIRFTNSVLLKLSRYQLYIWQEALAGTAWGCK
ncbi:hypothetical protein A0257_12350 [Hymenobacter psoromatis]|nr:hypothetical protein A0257_12350 [Hymenobacter psoromatis]